MLKEPAFHKTGFVLQVKENKIRINIFVLKCPVWMLLAKCSECISHNHTAHIKKCPDSIVGKQQRPQAFCFEMPH